MAAIIQWALHLFWQESLQSSIVSIILPAAQCLFPKKTGSSYSLFQRCCYYTIISRAYSQLFIRTLKFAGIQFHQHTFFQGISEHKSPWNKLLIEAAIFRIASILRKWQQPLQAATFSFKDFFRTPTCLEQLLLPNNYTLVTNAFSDQLLVEDKYVFSRATVLEEFYMQNE